MDAEETISKKKLKKKTHDAVDSPVAAAKLQMKPTAKIRYYDRHILICAGSDCKKRGSKGVRKALKDESRASGILGNIRTDTVDCLGLCKHGPNIVVYPEGTWYLGLEEAEVPEIVERHLKRGVPVERLAAVRRPRKAKS